MKSLIIAFLLCLSLGANAQKDTTKQKVFYLIMTADKWQELLNMIKTADEKPSVITQWQQLIFQNLHEIVDTTKKK